MTGPLETLWHDRTSLVVGTVDIEGNWFDDAGAVLTVALQSFFREYDDVRRAAAVHRHCNGPASKADVCRLADLHDATAVERIVERYAPRCTPEGEPGPAVRAVERVDGDTAALAVGAANVGIDGLDDAGNVVDVAVAHFYEAHEALRHAATARRYEDTPMTTGTAARMAGVQKGPEVEQLLRDHGVTPRVDSAIRGDESCVDTLLE